MLKIDEWRDGWQQFFAEKNRLTDEFWDTFDATPKGQRPPQSIDDLQSQVQSMYDAMAAKEDELTQRIDDLIASTVQDPEAQKAFMNARDTLAEMRKADKKAINEMYKKTASMEPAERQKAWNEFWAQRTRKYQDMRNVEAASIAIHQGDPEAMEMFTQARKAAEETSGEGFDVYKMAEKYGVPTATAKGTRNDRRILNTINKYLGQKEDLTVEKAIKAGKAAAPDASGGFAVVKISKRLARISVRDLLVVGLPALAVLAAGFWSAAQFIKPAPPDELVITTGSDGGAYQHYAARYKPILERFGIRLVETPSAGSIENLDRLADPARQVDVGFVQGGTGVGRGDSGLVSLGSLYFEPLWVF